MKLTEKQYKPLLESIEKWRQIERGEMPDAGIFNCSLCWSFHSDGCEDCPVRQETGQINCHKTPYVKWIHAAMKRHGVADTIELIHLAKTERKFLESLLPKRRRS